MEKQTIYFIIHISSNTVHITGADPGFQVRGGGRTLNKLRRAEGGANIFLVFRVKNHDFTSNNHIFSNCGRRRGNFGVFRIKNHDFTPQNHIFSNFLGPPLYNDITCMF